MKLALFPLPVFLLPGGKTRLRIFEPRYLRLVSQSLLHGNGFVICLCTINDEFYPIGSRVQIYDFEKDEQGVLTIDVEAVDRVEIGAFTVQSDGLKEAEIVILPHWQTYKLPEKQQYMASRLRGYLTSHPLYSDNLKDQDFKNLTWVCQRWLELLPIDDSKKYWLAKQSDCSPCAEFIGEVIRHEVL
ncbi:LON peptidase substrate-binding domain-containing protein [Psychromonas sp. MME2]|uniref:LON peptidase substrate-binding domain-containing protein n=1 Tax=unclassified Psychromonas TaxID=2614957 RepID=UPI00339BD943